MCVIYLVTCNLYLFLSLDPYQENKRAAEFDRETLPVEIHRHRTRLETHHYTGIERILFPETWGTKAKVSSEQAKKLLELRCEIFVKQFNKMRDSYKEIYRNLKKSGEGNALAEVKLDEPRAELNYLVFCDDEETTIDGSKYEDMIQVNMENYFDDEIVRQSLPKSRTAKSTLDGIKSTIVSNFEKSDDEDSTAGKSFTKLESRINFFL